MDSKYEEKQIELSVSCSTCGKPISDKARSNVTRFLSVESRCTCPKSEAGVGESAQQLTGCDPLPVAELDVDPQEIELIRQNLGERYEVVSLLGRGGMGAVYKVRDLVLEKTFAVKILNSQLVDDDTSVKRFKQEASAASVLTHPNLVAVYSYGIGARGAPYMVMDCLEGDNLAAKLAKDGCLDVPRGLDIFIQIVEGLVHAHNKDVIHRDVKPSNIIVTNRDGVEFVKLVDFGIAKVMPSETAATQLTQTGEVFGSPLYMSPEQCRSKKLDARSDIYAMGCVMYEALTGCAPFAADNPIETIIRHVNEDAKPISEVKEGIKVPKALGQVIMHCLEREPSNRYQTAAELLKDLNAVRDGKPTGIQPKGLLAMVDAEKVFESNGVTVYKTRFGMVTVSGMRMSMGGSLHGTSGSTFGAIGAIGGIIGLLGAVSALLGLAIALFAATHGAR